MAIASLHAIIALTYRSKYTHLFNTVMKLIPMHVPYQCMNARHGLVTVLVLVLAGLTGQTDSQPHYTYFGFRKVYCHGS